MKNSPSSHFESYLRKELVLLIRELRANGLQVPPDAGIDAVQALRTLDESNRFDVRTALESTLVSKAEDVPVFRAYFKEFWERFSTFLDQDFELGSPGENILRQVTFDEEDSGTSQLSETETEDLQSENLHSETKTPTEGEKSPKGIDLDSEQTTRSLYSPGGSTESTDVSNQVQSRTWSEVDAFLEAAGLLPGRRRIANPSGRRLNLRQAVRESFQTGGEIFEFPRRRRRKTVFRGCFLVDVSQSILDTIDTSFLLEFLSQVESRSRHCTIFFFDHSIRNVTEAFQSVHRKSSFDELKSPVTEWGGGTKIGESIRTLRREHSSSVDRRTGTFLLSDALDRGEPEVLERGIKWLRRRGGFTIWLNPLAAHPDYEPISRAMQICLPHINHLFGLAERNDLSSIASRLRKQGGPSRFRTARKYDPSSS